jgi:membrane associated rhomboid family serine protease
MVCNNTGVNNRLKHSLLGVSTCIALLWVIEIADRSLGLGLYRLGVYPGEPQGLWGILYAPLIHGSWGHLASNSFALLLLGVALLYGYPRAARPVLALVYIGSGIGVWLFARHSYHIGASGLTHGMMFFIFTTGILRRDRFSIALSMIVFFLFGGMVWTIFPQEPGISYESHFFGAICGVLAAFLFRDRDPRPAEKKYSWEDEDDEDSNDLDETMVSSIKNQLATESMEEHGNISCKAFIYSCSSMDSVAKDLSKCHLFLEPCRQPGWPSARGW